MKEIGKLLVTAAILTSAGCAPAMGTGPRIGMSPSGLRMSPSCMLYGDGLMAMTLGSSARFWQMRSEARAIQSYYSGGYSDIRSQMAGWKEVARGC